MEQLQQQIEQLQQIPGLEDLEGLLGGNVESLGGGTASQFFQNLAQQASARADQRQGQSLLNDNGQVQAQAAGNNRQASPLAANSLARPSRIGDSNNIDSQLSDMAEAGGGGGYFEDRIFAIMCKVVEDMQKKIEERLTKLQADAKAAEAEAESGGGEGGAKGGESRNIEFEKIKFDMQKLSQMQQAMSNVLNTMDELAKSAIRNIKG